MATRGVVCSHAALVPIDIPARAAQHSTLCKVHHSYSTIVIRFQSVFRFHACFGRVESTSAYNCVVNSINPHRGSDLFNRPTLQRLVGLRLAMARQTASCSDSHICIQPALPHARTGTHAYPGVDGSVVVLRIILTRIRDLVLRGLRSSGSECRTLVTYMNTLTFKSSLSRNGMNDKV